MVEVEASRNPNRVLAAVRLGWLTVEVFGRLRQYARARRRPRTQPSDAGQRFDFSERSLNEREALLLAIGQLRRTAASLGPGLPSVPLPNPNELDRLLDGQFDLDAVYQALNRWSTEVWIALSTEDDIVGRAFTYGGSLADTYWHAEVLGLEKFGRLLRAQRLKYIAQRFDSLAEYLPPYVAHVLHHTLYDWRIEGQLQSLDEEGRLRVLRQLTAQAKVWRDLLFGGRRAESYLTTRDERLILWGSAVATAVLLLGAMILVWLAVLALSSAGRSVTAAWSGVPRQLPEAQGTILEDALGWQNWSALLATVSSLVVLLTGLVTRLSGWVISFHRFVQDWLKVQAIYRRTYRSWQGA
jgi:hypothetical protein